MATRKNQPERRPSLPRGEVLSGIDGAKQWVDAGGLNIYPEETRLVAMRLLNDSRASTCWQRGLGAYEFENATHCYYLAVTRSAWSDKTTRERNDWKQRFDKSLSQLITLMEEAPTTPDQWGFPARGHVLIGIFRRAGYPHPDDNDTAAVWSRIRALEAAADAECWTIADALLHYQRQVEIDFDGQLLKKPRDAKAGRAEFIVNFKRTTNCTATVVAEVASVMFDDNAIDERLVRRLTNGRADF